MRDRERGFSLIELAIVAAIAGIMALIAAPAWVAFIQRQQLIQAQDYLYRIIQQTQQTAITQRSPQQISFRTGDTTVEWVIHSDRAMPAPTAWRPIQPAAPVEIDSDASTLRQIAGVYRLQFDYQGYVTGALGRITLKGQQPHLRRCVIVSTRLGALRKGRQHNPDGDCN